MQPVAKLKRSSDVAYVMCIICQSVKKDKLITAGEQGINTLQEKATERHKLHDAKKIEILLTELRMALIQVNH